MRAFDAAGVIAVGAWLSVVGYFVYDHYVAPQSHTLEGGAIFREGESYMLLTREDAEIGYIYESRTQVAETDSWLLEYDLMMNVSLMGSDQYLQTKIKATVNQAALLEEFSAAIETAGTTFELSGKVEDSVVTMSMDLAGSTRTQRIELRQAPRLSNSALNELVANPDLKTGMTFEQEYFDPTTMGMTSMTFEFVREHQIQVYDEQIDTFHFRQLVGGTELDAYVDKFGEVQLQEFPMRIVGARVPTVLGRSRAQAMRKKYEERAKNPKKKKTGDEPPDLSLEATIGLLKGGDLSGVRTSLYRITQIPDGVVFDLDSQQQRVLKKNEHSAEIDTAARFEGDAGPQFEGDQYLAPDLRVDSDSDAFGELLPKSMPETATMKAEAIARAVRKRLKVKPEVGIQTASAALAAGQGDCTEFALVLVAALRHHGIPARFVSGVKLDDAQRFILHQWVQYWDGQRFVDIDATSTTMLPGIDQIQLFTHGAPDKPELAAIIGQIKIEKVIADEPDVADGDPDSDFN